jgi:twitching motility protein PilT
MDLRELLARSVECAASDLHVSAGMEPMLRVDGELQRLAGPRLESAELAQMLAALMNEPQRQIYAQDLELDFAFEIRGLARFRVNAFHHAQGAAAAFRIIPPVLRSLDDLPSPGILKEIAAARHGLVLVTGPSGSGKSTTLAALLDHINETQDGHILTIEDPIEFLHPSKRCLVQQREVQRDTHSFAAALRSALRANADTILVGELRDLESIRLALTAAETGHLVCATLHTNSAAKTIDRVVDVFPAGEKEMVRTMLSESLRAVVAQVLVKRPAGRGRMAAYEVMIGTSAIRNLIRENKVAQMYSAIQTGLQQGMQTLDQCLADLVRRGLVTNEEARRHASNRTQFS